MSFRIKRPIISADERTEVLVTVIKNTPATKKSATIPPPGRKLSSKEARALAHKQFGKTLARLAK